VQYGNEDTHWEQAEGEGDDGDACDVPADLVELYEVLEWERAVQEAQE